MRFGFYPGTLILNFFNFIILANLLDRSREDSKDEHMHLSDAVLEPVMVFRLAAGAVAEVVVPLGRAKAGFLSGCTVVLGIVAATEERSEDA